MGYIQYNPNPDKKMVGDCVIRALTILFNDTWEHVYADVTIQGAFIIEVTNRRGVAFCCLSSFGGN